MNMLIKGIYTMKYLLLLILLAPQTLPAEDWLHFGGWSHHPNSDTEFNEDHNMIGFETGVYNWQVQLLKFDNSFNKKSFYLSMVNREVFCYEVCAGYSVGFATGYPNKDPGLIGTVVFSYEIYEGIAIDVNWLSNVVTETHLRINQDIFDNFNINAPWKTKGYFKVTIDQADPDGRRSLGFDRDYGTSYTLQLYTKKDWYLIFNYTDTRFSTTFDTDDEKFNNREEQSFIDSQGSTELWKELDSFDIGISYNQIYLQHNYIDDTGLVEVPKKHYRGFGVHVGQNYQITDKLSARVELAYIDRFIPDVKLTGELKYQISDDYLLTLGTKDWGKQNYSQYFTGIQYNF